jgi:plastocyanin
VRRLVRTAFSSFLSLVLLACSNPTTRQPDPAGSVCIETKDRLNDPGAVVVKMENNPVLPAFIASRVYAPSEITAKVGQLIEFTSADPDEQHTAELDSGACGTDYLSYKASDDLVFKVAGTYPFYCLVHGTTMAGTITIVP